jgi:aryl-alcohol dehydrogenase-like predicted oxidoreductase
MRTSPLGPSGIEASVVGLGTWGIGGWMWGGADESQAVQAIQRAIDEGVTLIDTAPIYGFGRSEQIIAQAIEGRRDQVVLASKCGMVANTTQGRLKFRSDVAGPNENGLLGIYIYLHPESIRWELDCCLRRLKTDRIDLFQTHWQEEQTPRADVMDTLLDLKKQGKIRAIGVCNANTQQMDEYRQRGQLDTDQEKFSMLDRKLEEAQLPYTQRHGMAMLAYSPLARGLLSGKIGPDFQFDPSDERRQESRFSVENRRRVSQMLHEIQPIAADHGLSVAQLALAWTLHRPGLTHTLAGARRPEHAASNVKAADVRLTDDEMQRIKSALQRSQGSTPA